MEIATQVRLGKRPATNELIDNLPKLLQSKGFDLLPITLQHGLYSGDYALPHREPFDHRLATKAELDHLTLVSLDPALKASLADWPGELSVARSSNTRRNIYY